MDTIEFTFQVNGINGTKWVGATLRNASGVEQDQDAIQVENGKTYNLSTSISPALHSGGGWDMNANINSIQYMLALWGNRIDARNCKSGVNGKPCNYCQKNGYHMEERLVDTGWGTLGHYPPYAQ